VHLSADTGILKNYLQYFTFKIVAPEINRLQNDILRSPEKRGGAFRKLNLAGMFCGTLF